MANFADNDHALVTGVVIGILAKAGISAYPGVDEVGNYVPVIRMRVDVGHARPMNVELEVRASSGDDG